LYSEKKPQKRWSKQTAQTRYSNIKRWQGLYYGDYEKGIKPIMYILTRGNDWVVVLFHDINYIM